MKKPIEKKLNLQKFKDWFYLISITLLIVFTIETRIELEMEKRDTSFEIIQLKGDSFRKASKLDTMEYIERRLQNRNAQWPLPENIRDED